MDPNFWSGKKVLVTGGAGFLGSRVVGLLREAGLAEDAIRIPRSRTADLRDRKVCAEAVLGIDIVIHAAVTGGGIGFNRANPGRIFYDNIVMTTELMEAARLAGVKKFLGVGTICSYPKNAPVPFRERDLWEGYPEETNGAYGLAKKMMLVQAEAYHREYGFNAVVPLFENLYGPGDDFDPESSHVIPALIRKFDEAKRVGAPSVTVWGSGGATRGFLYVDDAARAILLLVERYNSAEPVNIGSGGEIAIRDLAAQIARLTDFHGEIIWDTEKPDGQPKRSVDTSLAAAALGWRATTPFEAGLEKTIEWYRDRK